MMFGIAILLVVIVWQLGRIQIMLKKINEKLALEGLHRG
jgi:uncharacterized membrane protein